MAYGGGSSFGGALDIWSSDVTVRDSTVRESQSHGIYLRGAGKTPAFERVRFENNAWAAIRFDNPGNRPLLADLVATGNGRDGIELSGSLEADGLMDGGAAKLPYVVTGDTVIGGDRTMTVNPGTTVQFTGGANLRAYGTLIAEGTAGQPILFTSQAGTPAKGDWAGIALYDAAHARLAHCTVAYGGGSSFGGALDVWSSDVTVRDSTVRESQSHGIFLRGAGKTPTFARVRFENNAWAAIRFENAGNTPVLADLVATGNGLNGIEVWRWLDADAVFDGGAAKIPYIVNYSVEVGATRALTITPGTTVQFMPGAMFQVDGTLEAQGTAERPIVFTSLAAAPAPGDWREIILRTGSKVRLAHCEIAYSGYGNAGSLIIASTDVTVSDCTVRDGSAHGVLLRGAGVRPALDRVTMLRNAWAALRFEDPGQSPVLASLSASGNGADAISVGGGTLGASATWDASRALLPIQVDGDTRVPSGQFLSLAAGTTVRFGPDGYFTVYGNLYTLGTSSQPVVLTGTTQTPGAWRGVSVQGGGRAILDRVELSYGGRYSNALLYVAGNAIVSNSRITGSSSDGVRTNNAQPALLNNAIEGNAFGVRNNTPATSVDARQNWWGHASGPYHASNTPGQGNAVSDGVLFDPWLTEPPAGVQAASAGLVLSLGAPRRVSPGGTADYAIFYMNAMTRTVTNAVVVLALPGSSQLVDTTGGGIHWPELGQVFWRLGNLQPGASGVLTARVRFDWGLPQGLMRPAAAFFLGDGLSSGGLEVAPYLAYAPFGPVSRTPLTDAELSALLAASPDLSTLYQQSLASGMILGPAERLRYADNSTVMQLGLVAPDTGRLAILTNDVNGAAATIYAPDQLGVRTATGGMTTTVSTGEWDFWGTWDPPTLTGQAQDQPANGIGAVPAGVDRLPQHPFTQCVSNCMLVKFPKWFVTFVDPVIKVLNNAKTCLDAVREERRDAAIKCLNTISLQLPLLGQAVDISMCITGCDTPAKWVNWKCRPGKTMSVCGSGGTVFGTLYEWQDRNPYQQYECDEWGNWTQGWAKPCGKKFKCIETMRDGLGSAICVRNVACIGPSLPKSAVLAEEDEGAGADSCTEVFTGRDPNAKHGPAGDLLPGKPVTYTVEWENVGEGVAYGVYVTDELSDLFDETTLDLQGNGEYLASARTILWDVGELAPKGQPGSTGQVTFTVALRPGLPGGTALTNQAIVFFPSVPERTPTNVVVNVLAPITARPLQVETDAEQPVQITLSGEDPGGAVLAFAVDEEPLYGALDGAPPTVTYTPLAGFNGQDRFTYTASNAITTSRPAEVTILVNPSAAADTQPPEVQWTLPADGATGVEARSNALYEDETGPVYGPVLAIAFDEPMDAASLASALQLQAPGGALIPLAVIWDGSLNRALAAPRQPLDDGALHTARVTTAAHDAAGNALAAAYSWTFRTAPGPAVYLPLLLRR